MPIYSYLPSCRASPPFGRYQIILLCVWTTCPGLLPGSAPSRSRTSNLAVTSQICYHYITKPHTAETNKQTYRLTSGSFECVSNYSCIFYIDLVLCDLKKPWFNATLFARCQHQRRFPLRPMLSKISKWSRIQDSCRITPKIESLVVCAMPDIPSKFQKNPSITFWVILVTHWQTNKQKPAKTLPPWRR